jgi:acyl-CoA dehydrogenase
MSNELLEPFDRMLADAAPPDVVRAVDGGASAEDCWLAVAASGFLDALVPEDAGGAGLSLTDIDPLLRALGARAFPLPVAETIFARALLVGAGIERPEGAVVLGTAIPSGDGWSTAAVPLAALAHHALIDLEGEILLIDVDDRNRVAVDMHGSRSGVLIGTAGSSRARFKAPAAGVRPLAAVIRATAIAGACDRLLDLTVAYANERVQFGKPIGRQQALQQQLAVMAENVVAARIAAQFACAAGLPVGQPRAAIAKVVTSQAVVPVAAVAHAVHGAIGISEEYDLQLYTRRLHEWRVADGSEGYWSQYLGSERIGSSAATSTDFVRSVT